MSAPSSARPARPQLPVTPAGPATPAGIAAPADPEPAEPEDAGQLDLEDRHALRRVAGLSTELQDVTEVEYRALRLERGVLMGVWTDGTLATAENSLRELSRLAETAGSQVLDGLIHRRGRPDSATYVAAGRAAEPGREGGAARGPVGGDGRVHQRREGQPGEPADRGGGPGGRLAVRHARPGRAEGPQRVRLALHADRHGGLRPAPSAPARGRL